MHVRQRFYSFGEHFIYWLWLCHIQQQQQQQQQQQ
jgi:hypothetical protein